MLPNKPARCLSARSLRVALLAACLALGHASAALADPRLVRVIWDVGGDKVYYKAFSRTEIGYSSFQMPADAATATSAGGFKLGLTPFLEKGDRVRVYVVNYNPVAHVWHESSVVEQVAETPSLIGPLLNAAVLAITGAKPLPSQVVFTTNALKDVTTATATCSNQDITLALAQLNELLPAARTLYTDTTSMVKRAKDDALTDNAAKVAAVPAHASLWQEFDNAKAWQAITTVAVGFIFSDRYRELAAEIKRVSDQIDAVNKELLDFDKAIAIPGALLPPECAEDAKRLLEHRDNIASVVKELVGPDSEARAVITTYQTAAKQWADYQKRLTVETWANQAQEVALKDPVQDRAVLRIDGAFVSPEKTVTLRILRSAVLGVQTFVPTMIISAGIGYNRFDFQTLQIVKDTTTVNGAVVAKNTFAFVDDTTWDPITPVWLTSVRVWKGYDIGLYGTFGTTPDRNIFKNAIVGASLAVPKIRAVFTYGRIFARGYVEKDWGTTLDEFKDADGFVLADVNAANVPQPEKGWADSSFYGLSFVLASF